jgi:YHS domain-containing protein
MLRKFLWRFTLGVALLGVSALRLSAQAVNTDKSGVAANGQDLVAYFTENAPVSGLASITATHGGATYRFATATNRDAFQADPGKYLPLYGGYCAYGVANGYKVKTDPDAFSIVDGKLYLNYDKGVQRKWQQDVAGYVARADSNWQRIREAPRK